MKNPDKKYIHIYYGCGIFGSFFASFFLIGAIIPDLNLVFRMLVVMGACIFYLAIIQKNEKMVLGGSALGLVASVIQCVSVLLFLTDTQETSKSALMWSLLSIIAMIAVFGLGILAYFKKEKVDSLIKYACYISSFSFVPLFFANMNNSGTASSIASTIARILAMLCISYFDLLLPQMIIKRAKKQEGDTARASTDKIEKITQLKGLLDAGAITQEDFDEKKKQILGL